MPRLLPKPVRGVSLVEMLVGMTIALMVLAIALQLMLLARARYQRLADEALIEERGNQALELLGRAVRQAGWITDTPASTSIRSWPHTEAPSLMGAENCHDPKITPAFGCNRNDGKTGDALLVRFAGRSAKPDGVDADGATRDCGGYGVPERAASESDPHPGRMLLFVGPNSTDKELELRCKSLDRKDPSKDGDAQGMVRGVETLQLLYTLGPFASAPRITKSARAMANEDWGRVREVHVSIIVRGERSSARKPVASTIALFPHLPRNHVEALREDLSFTPADPGRNRAHFVATFAVRNPLVCEVNAC